MTDELAVVGGGAAGLMAAVTAAENGAKVVLFEKNASVGKKLLITGKGRCNVTNDCDLPELINHVAVNGKFLYSAFSAFDATSTKAFFESAGVPLKTERGRRVFPVSDRSYDILAVFKKKLKDLGVKTLNAAVDAVDKDLTIHYGGRKEAFGAVIIATGGLSYPATGATGDGYKMAKALGHTVTPLRPALVPVKTAEKWVREAAGLSLKNVVLRCDLKGKKLFSELGEMLFTHDGISGPLVLSLSSCLKENMLGESLITVDLKPALDMKTLDARILRDFAASQNRELKNVLRKLLPASIIPPVLTLSGVDGEKVVNSVTASERRALAETVKALKLTPTGFGGFDEAVVTSGGVSVKEIEPATMQSKLVKGLYFAGEVIDVDAFTGGYNLQIAFSTGNLAGQSAAKSLKTERKEKTMKKHVNVAVDGPSGAGKSTLCDMLADKYGLIHLDTGALYRAVGAYALEKEADVSDKDAVAAILEGLSVTVRFEDGKQHIIVNGDDYTDRLYRPEMSMAASAVSAHPPVREFLLETQRSIARENSVILDGRDIGTVVLPDADIKIFITVDAESRAKRRYRELLEKGFTVDYDTVYAEILKRDENDSTRAVAPLRRADDAVDFVNSDGIEESFKRLCDLVEAMMK